jgi:hypothetical protein
MSKNSDEYDRKSSKNNDSDADEFYDGKEEKQGDVPSVNVEVLAIEFLTPETDEITAPLSIKVVFDLDSEVIAGIWDLKFLVDTAGRRVIKQLVEVVEDYPDGENDMLFNVSFNVDFCWSTNLLIYIYSVPFFTRLTVLKSVILNLAPSPTLVC